VNAPHAHRLLLREGRRLWAAATRFDGFDPGDLVIRLSPGNPYRRDLDAIVSKAAELGFRLDIQPRRKSKKTGEKGGRA
jgi:hypothetical protein